MIVLDTDYLTLLEWKGMRLRIGTMDLKIAAIVLEYNATLLSGNLSHFLRVPELKVEDWLKPSRGSRS